MSDLSTTDRSIRVLIVDDEPDFAALSETYLERLHDEITVVTEQDVAAAVERLRNDGSIDCIVSDYDMPGRNGLDLLDAIRTLSPDMPFILFTGKGSEEIASRAISAGVTDYLQKTGGREQFELLANRIEHASRARRVARTAETRQSHLDTIIANLSDAIITIDESSTIHFANASVERVFGYKPADLVGRKLTVLMPDRLREDHLDALERYVETGEKQRNWSEVEFPGQRKDGTEIPLSISFGEFWDGEERRFTGCIRDISGRDID